MKYYSTTYWKIRGLFPLWGPLFVLVIPLFVFQSDVKNMALGAFLIAIIILLARLHLRVQCVEITPAQICITRGKKNQTIKICEIKKINELLYGAGYRIIKQDNKTTGIPIMHFSHSDKALIKKQLEVIFSVDK